MWLLSPIEGIKTSKCVGLVSGTEHVVGRKDCSVLIQGDPSISRRHAVITVQHSQDSLGDPGKLAKVFLEDSSKYGTFLNGNRVSGTLNLNSGDKILFGKNNSHFRLEYTPLVVVPSCLDENKKKELRSNIIRLGGHIINEWRPGIVTHLVMDGLMFTIKVIHALADCCPIVTPAYFDDLINGIDKDFMLPPLEGYLPDLKEETISPQGVSFLPNEARRTLFTGKTFIFISKKQHKRMRHAVELSGGISVLRDSQGSETDSGLVSRDVCVMMVDPKEQNAFPAISQQWIAHVVETLRRHKCRPIPESEVGLALLYVSLDKYCNPSITAVPPLTQSLVDQSFQAAEVMSQRICSEQFTVQEMQFKKPTLAVKQIRETQPQSVDKVLIGPQDDETASRICTGKRFACERAVVDAVPDSQYGGQSLDNPSKRRKLTADDFSVHEETTTELTNKTKSNLELEIADSCVEDTLEVNLGLDNDFNAQLQYKEKEVAELEVVADSLDCNENSHTFLEGPNHDTGLGKKCEHTANMAKETEVRVEERYGDLSSCMRVNHSCPTPTEAQRQCNKGFANNKRSSMELQEHRNTQVEDMGPVEPLRESDIPTGFLCTSLPRKISGSVEASDDEEIPRNLVVVGQMSLVVSRPSVSRKTGTKTNNVAKNFKKFKKQLYPGSGLSLPRIIGGSDLAVYQAYDQLDKDEWFLEAKEADAERQREEKLAEELFRTTQYRMHNEMGWQTHWWQTTKTITVLGLVHLLPL